MEKKKKFWVARRMKFFVTHAKLKISQIGFSFLSSCSVSYVCLI